MKNAQLIFEFNSGTEHYFIKSKLLRKLSIIYTDSKNSKNHNLLYFSNFLNFPRIFKHFQIHSNQIISPLFQLTNSTIPKLPKISISLPTQKTNWQKVCASRDTCPTLVGIRSRRFCFCACSFRNRL